MKRERKFRAKSVNSGRWVYGYYFITPLTNEDVNCSPNDGWFFLTGKTHHCISQNGSVFEIDPGTLGELVHILEDGRELYEGDIIYTLHEGYMQLKWNDDRKNFMFFNGANVLVFERAHKWIDDISGNIHDNPELLIEQNYE